MARPTDRLTPPSQKRSLSSRLTPHAWYPARAHCFSLDLVGHRCRCCTRRRQGARTSQDVRQSGRRTFTLMPMSVASTAVVWTPMSSCGSGLMFDPGLRAARQDSPPRRSGTGCWVVRWIRRFLFPEEPRAAALVAVVGDVVRDTAPSWFSYLWSFDCGSPLVGCQLASARQVPWRHGPAGPGVPDLGLDHIGRRRDRHVIDCGAPRCFHATEVVCIERVGRAREGKRCRSHLSRQT